MSRVEVWRAGARVDPYGDKGLPIYSGQVEIDGAKQVRRTLTGLRVDATDDTWALLSPVGTQLRCWRGFRYLNEETELIPVGRFTLDALTENYGGNWDGTIDTAPDLMARVQRARFLQPRTFPAGTRLVDVIAVLLSDVLGPVTVTATSTAVLPSDAVYERDRLQAVADNATAAAADVFIAPDGTPMVVDARQLDTPVWTVDAGSNGVLYTAARQRATDQVYSAVVAIPAQIDGVAPFDPQIVYDDDPASPTYYLGDFGIVPYFMASELFGDAPHALAAAQARLPLVTALRAQADLTAECNPALDAFDSIQVDLPRRLRGQTASSERQLIRTLTVPLTADGVQTMSTASSATDVEASA